ncbi:hypothetical protein A5633_03425 [Mycolicibacterium elephantis]|nr:hypothetical protein A5633_03425 [Mycolicibacterium elephantis]OBE98047.1 hypothetical protein A5776_15410 [Mycolicibacterium elephantis]
MLDIYLDREAVQFDRRFRGTAAHLERSLFMVASGVDDVVERVSEVGQDIEAAIGDQIQRLEDAAWQAANEAEESKSVAESLQMDVGTVLDRLPVSAFWSLRQKRVLVWMKFAMDAVSRPTKATPIVEQELRYWLEQPIDANDWLMNQTEWEFWTAALARRGEKGRMAWWGRYPHRGVADAPVSVEGTQGRAVGPDRYTPGRPPSRVGRHTRLLLTPSGARPLSS